MRDEIIIRNSIRCLKCGDEIESKHRHDFRRCRCGAVAVDGGQTWLRRVGRFEDWVDTSIVEITDVPGPVGDADLPDDIAEAIERQIAPSEASNILRRFIRVAAQLDPRELGYLKKSARTLHPDDLRRLANEIADLRPRRRGEAVAELRGLARSIITYGGPDAVRRDADRMLVDAVNSMGWTP